LCVTFAILLALSTPIASFDAILRGQETALFFARAPIVLAVIFCACKSQEAGDNEDDSVESHGDACTVVELVWSEKKGGI
jgi:hypothetical protein